MISEAVLGPHHPDTAIALNNVGKLHQHMGDYNAAIPLSTRALEIREAVLGPRDRKTAISLSNLELPHGNMGDCNAAIPLLVRALEIGKAVLGPRDPDTAIWPRPSGTSHTKAYFIVDIQENTKGL